MTFLPAQISASTSTPVSVPAHININGDSGGSGSGGGVGGVNGVSGTGGGRVLVGPVPRSAKKWARSAHLHEVRRVGVGVVVKSPSLSLSPPTPTPTPEEDEGVGGAEGEGEGEGEGGEVMDTGRGDGGGVSVVEVHHTNGKGKERGMNGSVLGPAFEEGLMNGGAEGNGDVEADSGEETWVDTDADSEVEGEKQLSGG